MDADNWLECNGQAVDAVKYPKLVKLMSHVPDFQGIFLRGLGTQSSGGTTYSSGSLNTIQGDAIRNITSTLGQQQWSQWNGGSTEGFKGQTNNVFYYTNGPIENGMASFPRTHGGYINDRFTSNTNFGHGWDEALTHYKYNLVGDKDSGYTLQETTEKPILEFYGQCIYLNMDLSLQVPTANEVRPVSKAVKYMIKAR